jgi:two-component system, sensor histidine kinase LadS
MKKWKHIVLGLLFLSFMSFANGNPIAFDVYQLENKSKNWTVEQVLKADDFLKIDDIGALNFGLSTSSFWLKIVVKNTHPDATYKLVLSTITPDTIEIYAANEGNFKKELIGEAIPSNERFLNYYFKPTGDSSAPNLFGMSQNAIFYLKINGDGQPIALPLSIIRCDVDYDVGIFSILFSGLLYGFVCFILIINIVLFVGTREKLYLYFLIFNIFCTGVVLYFDGFVKLLIFQTSVYWNNQFIAIALCGSFISLNYYLCELLKLKIHQPVLNQCFRLVNVVFVVIGILSFWHPIGFSLFIKSNLILTSVEAFFLFYSVLMMRQKEKDFFIAQLISIGLVIIFGTITQLYFWGVLPVNLLTRYAVHGMILPQIFIQTFILFKRFKTLAEEQLMLQTTLLAASEQYSQSLISTLENERKRLSGEFHDSIGQNLLVIRNRILLMLKQNQTNGQKEKLDGLAAITSETLDEIRDISQNLRPTTLDTIGLTASLSNMLARLKRSTEIKIEVVCPQNIDEIVAKELEINVYRILQELMSNVLKHSKASHATVTITQNGHQLLIQIKDDGVGFDTLKMALTNAGNGFTSIKERVKILRGDMTINSEIQKGTTVDIILPIDS